MEKRRTICTAGSGAKGPVKQGEKRKEKWLRTADKNKGAAEPVESIRLEDTQFSNAYKILYTLCLLKSWSEIPVIIIILR